ncbi:MAG: kynureninase [Chitinophagales bacterium]|nr:kynureninase [Chitinophagales bacterium]MDW8393941.1 kynureninase [Chitinophagales bacterium]
MQFKNDQDFARGLDEQDPLRRYRSAFAFPIRNGQPVVYLAGNSLGLMPLKAQQYVTQELRSWAELGVDGHFHGRHPWYYYHHFGREALARLVGARPDEVVAMGSLTANLHLLLVSFYRPTRERYKILMENSAFPSDQHAIASHVRCHGLDAQEAVVELRPRPGELTLHTEDIVEHIRRQGDALATILLGGVNYLTGQFFDLPTITREGHAAGATVGFDLAHAAGNVPLHLHDWDVDFACWCSYKYLNSGPGGVAGIFVHERHGRNAGLPRFAGWWGHDEQTRFRMEKSFIPQPGAAGWQLSNAPVLPMAAHRAALELFDEAGMQRLREKSERLTAFLEFLVDEYNTAFPDQALELITPRQAAQRGCQLSFRTGSYGRRLFEALGREGIVCDWRPLDGDPDAGVIRMAPVPLYNSFEDVWRAAAALQRVAAHQQADFGTTA